MMGWLLAGLAAWLLALAMWWFRVPGPGDAAPPGPDPHAADVAVFRRQVADFSRG